MQGLHNCSAVLLPASVKEGGTRGMDITGQGEAWWVNHPREWVARGV
jgi:hypothetical protein